MIVKFLAGLSKLHYSSPEETFFQKQRDYFQGELTNFAEKSLYAERMILISYNSQQKILIVTCVSCPGNCIGPTCQRK